MLGFCQLPYEEEGLQRSCQRHLISQVQPYRYQVCFSAYQLFRLQMMLVSSLACTRKHQQQSCEALINPQLYGIPQGETECQRCSHSQLRMRQPQRPQFLQ